MYFVAKNNQMYVNGFTDYERARQAARKLIRKNKDFSWFVRTPDNSQVCLMGSGVRVIRITDKLLEV